MNLKALHREAEKETYVFFKWFMNQPEAEIIYNRYYESKGFKMKMRQVKK
jgi:hypothetical protein